jgi:HupE / UreJ protein
MTLFNALVLGVSMASAVLAPLSAHAHKASDAYLSVNQAQGTELPLSSQGALQLTFTVALRDLDLAIDTLDANDDRQLSFGEVRAAKAQIEALVGKSLGLRCAYSVRPLRWSTQGLEQRSDGAYLRLDSTSHCPSKSTLTLDYRFLLSLDPTHRLLITGQLAGQALALVTAAQTTGHAGLELTPGLDSSTRLSTLGKFFVEGFRHLLGGLDHLAFLLSLVLGVKLMQGTVFARAGGWQLLKTITAFTVGHSLTLGLASYGWIAPPGWVEPAIAISIAVSALLNLYPQRWLPGALLALVFGLVHGLGFSGVMTEAGVSPSLLLWALAGFNLGLEAAQLCALGLWLLAYVLLARWSRYEAIVVRGGSIALVLLALVWTGQRVI